MNGMQSEERDLLAAIIADPDDDTLRLAYADWLDENAETLPAARRAIAIRQAELIRLQIEEAGLILGAPGFTERYHAIQERERELLRSPGAHEAMVAELGVTLARGVRLWCRRGLFGELNCTVKYFVQHGAALLDVAPITAVRLKQLAVSNVKSLTTCPHLARVRTLKVYAHDNPHDAILALLDRVPLAHLRGLVIDSWFGNHGSTDLADPLVERVARCENLAGLKWLNFHAAGVSSVGGRALAASPYLANLDVLDLRVNPTLRAVATMRKRFGKRVWLDYDDVQGLPIGNQNRD